MVCERGQIRLDVAEKIEAFADAGFDHVFLHQVGPRQEEFLAFAKDELLPTLDR